MYDAIVAGLGGMGSAAAYHLAGRGKRVLGLERFTPAHDKGSSHGQSRIIRQAYFEDPAYVPLLLRAYELWERLEKETGEDLMTLTGGLMIGPPESDIFKGSKATADEYGLPYEVFDAAELERRYPMFEPTGGTVALFEEKAGFLRPEAAVKAHLSRAQALGADLGFGEEIVSWQPTDFGVRVETESDVYEAERLVVTAGPWAPKLLAGMGLPLEVTRQILFWFDPKGGVEPFLPDRFPIFIWEPEDGNAFYSIPAHDGTGGGVKVAFFRADGTPADPDTIDREVHTDELQFMRSYLALRQDLHVHQHPGRALRDLHPPRPPAGRHRGGLLGSRFQVLRRGR
jgi:sarcosine oxidase